KADASRVVGGLRVAGSEVDHLLGPPVGRVPPGDPPAQRAEQVEVERERPLDVGDREIEVVEPLCRHYISEMPAPSPSRMPSSATAGLHVTESGAPPSGAVPASSSSPNGSQTAPRRAPAATDSPG